MDERALLTDFFASLDGGDVIAMTPSQAGGEQAEGHDVAREVARRRGSADPVWVFWHQQSAWVFDGNGDLTAPLLIHWGGDHDRVAAILAGVPAPLRLVDHGPRGAFGIVSDDMERRRSRGFPDVADTPAVKDRIRLITGERRQDSEWTEDEVAWMNEVLECGDRAAQGAVVRWLAGSERLTDAAYEALVGDWQRIYVAAPTDVLVWTFLRSMAARGDERLENVIEACVARPRHTFSAGVAYFLGERGDPADLPRLRQLAVTPGKYAHSPGNAPALDGWVRVTALSQGRSEADVAEEALDDPAFDAGAVKRLSRIAARTR